MKHLFIPPVPWAGLLILMYLLRDMDPFGIVLATPAHMLGWIVIAIGFCIQVIAAGQFAKARTNIHAFNNPDHLVTGGVFALSRNPMYLGFVLTLFGAAVLFNTVLALIAPVVFFVLANTWYIPREERIAERIFGDAYQAYRTKVRRWL